MEKCSFCHASTSSIMCDGCYSKVCKNCAQDDIICYPTGDKLCSKCSDKVCQHCLELGGEEIEAGYSNNYCEICGRALCENCTDCWKCLATF